MMAWRTILAAWTMVGVAATGDSAEAASCKLAQVATWPLRLVRNHLLVDGEINGQKIGVMLDTGAMKTIVFRSLAIRLGLTRKATGAQLFGIGGRSAVEVALVDEFKIGQAERKQLWMLVAGEQDVGDDGSVLLGEDFFQAFDVEFDLAHNAVRLFQAHECDGKSLAYWTNAASEVALDEIDANRPQIIVPIEVNGRALSALLDSGAHLSLLERTGAARVGVTPETPGVVAGGRITGLGKNAVDAWIGPIKSFAIGNETIEDTQIRFSDTLKESKYTVTGSSIPVRPRVSYDMILGVDFLRSHRLLVAHSQRKVYFTYAGGPVFQLNQPPAPTREPQSTDDAKPEAGKN